MLEITTLEQSQPNITKNIPLDEVINSPQLFLATLLVSAQQAKMVVKFTGTGRSSETFRVPVPRNLSPPLLFGLKFHQTSSNYTNTGLVQLVLEI